MVPGKSIWVYVCSGEYMNIPDVPSRQADFTIPATTLLHREKTCPSRHHVRMNFAFSFSPIGKTRMRYPRDGISRLAFTSGLGKTLGVKLECYVRWISGRREVFGERTESELATRRGKLATETFDLGRTRENCTKIRREILADKKTNIFYWKSINKLQ